MKERILSELRAEYEAQRAANRQEEARRVEHASSLDPEIGRLMDERVSLFRDKVREAFSSDRGGCDASALTEAFKRIATRLGDRLAEIGLPRDYLQPVYRCSGCRDQGYVGEPIREMCDCMKRSLYARLCDDTMLGITARESFAAWDADVFSTDPLPGMPQGQRAYMARVRSKCERYADAFPNNEKPNMLFSGASGLGKTFLLNCVGGRALERGYTPWKLASYELMRILRDGYFERGDPELQRMLTQTKLLMIDDLGAEPMQENLTIPQLYALINERVNRRLATIISTNLTPDEIIRRYTERLASRMLDQRLTDIYMFVGSDVRLTQPRTPRLIP